MNAFFVTLTLSAFMFLATFSTHARAQQNNICLDLPALALESIQKVVNVETSEEEVVKVERAALYSKFDACITYRKASAEAQLKRAKTELFRQKAEGERQVALGAESILNGSKLICPNRVSQGSGAQEFVCYKDIAEALLTVLAQ